MMTRVRILHKNRQTDRPTALTWKHLQSLDQAEVDNLSWQEVQRALAQAPQTEQTQPWNDPDAKPALTIDDVKGMDESQLSANWDRVQEALKGQYRKEAN